VFQALQNFGKVKTGKKALYYIFEPLEVEESIDFKITCLSLINGLLINTEDVKTRFELRNRFIMLGLPRFDSVISQVN
jgi:hypothetical protein